jgi:hypothetical protein
MHVFNVFPLAILAQGSGLALSFSYAMAGASDVLGQLRTAFTGQQKRRSDENDEPAAKTASTAPSMADLTEALRLVMKEELSPLREDVQGLKAAMEEQKAQTGGLRGMVEVHAREIAEVKAKTIDNGEIVQLVKDTVKQQLESSNVVVATQLPNPAGKCTQSDKDDLDAGVKLQLRIQGKVERKEWNVLAATAFTQVGLNLAELGAKVLGGKNNKVYKGAPQTRITVKFNDVEDRQLCRSKLIDMENNFEPQATYKGNPVEVWRVEPLYVMYRQSRFFDNTKMLARRMGVKYEELDVNPKWDERTVYHKGELVGYQDLVSWEFVAVKGQ